MILLQDVFTYDYRMGHDDDGHSLGYSRPRPEPHITQRMAERGVKIDPRHFRCRRGPKGYRTAAGRDLSRSVWRTRHAKVGHRNVGCLARPPGRALG